MLVSSIEIKGESLLDSCLQTFRWWNHIFTTTGSCCWVMEWSCHEFCIYLGLSSTWVSSGIRLYSGPLKQEFQWGMLWMFLNPMVTDFNWRQYWRPKDNVFILELLKLSNLNKLSEFESNNYTFISPIQPPFVMTQGNTYGSTDSSPGDHQFSTGLWPVFFRQFLFYAFKKITFVGHFSKNNTCTL